MLTRVKRKATVQPWARAGTLKTEDSLAEGVEFELWGDFLNGQ